MEYSIDPLVRIGQLRRDLEGASEPERRHISQRIDLYKCTWSITQALQAIRNLSEPHTTDEDVLGIMSALLDASWVFETLAPLDGLLAATRAGRPYDLGEGIAGASAHMTHWNMWAMCLEMLVGKTLAGRGPPDPLIRRVRYVEQAWSELGETEKRLSIPALRRGPAGRPWSFALVGTWCADLWSEHHAADSVLQDRVHRAHLELPSAKVGDGRSAPTTKQFVIEKRTDTLVVVREGDTAAEVRGTRGVWLFLAVFEASPRHLTWESLLLVDMAHAGATMSRRELARGRSDRNLRTPKVAMEPASMAAAGRRVRGQLGKLGYHWHQDGNGARWDPTCQ